VTIEHNTDQDCRADGALKVCRLATLTKARMAALLKRCSSPPKRGASPAVCLALLQPARKIIMIAATEPGRFTPEMRTAFYFLTLFMSGGAAAAYAGIWFSKQGLTPGEIGIVGALPVLVMLLFNVVIGRMADRASDWRTVIVIGALIAAVMPFGLFFAHGFAGILTVWTLAAIAQMAVVPVADAAAMRMGLRRGSDLSAFRAWGTIGFMSMILLTGVLTGWFGAWVFVPLFVGLSVLRGLAALTLPSFRAQAGEVAKSTGARRLSDVMQLWFVLPLVGWSMVYATHLWLNAFQALLWSRQGLSEPVIAVLIALGALSEAVLFFAFRRFGRGTSARKLALLSGLVTVVRWGAMAFTPDVVVLVPLQLLHSITFALGFMGCVQFIANWTSEDIAAEAQGFFVMVQQICGVAVILTGGWLVETWGGPVSYAAAAGVAALGSLLIWGSLRLQQPRATASAA
jgi:MFS transporter, PPP family, 3-phenylpropionic acid transporter